LDVVQQGAVTLELEVLLGTFDGVGFGCLSATQAGAGVGFDDSAVGEPAAAVVISLARVLALFPRHLLCATEFAIPAQLILNFNSPSS
jgi:hypothetical protein